MKEKQRTAELLQTQAEASNAAHMRLSGIIEKNFAQLRAADPWQYQAIMSMNGTSLYDDTYDPSEEAEAQRIAERTNKKEELEESLNAQEAAVLSELFPGFQQP